MRKIFYVFLLSLWVGNVLGQCNRYFYMSSPGDVWYFPAANDTLTQGDSSYINIKYTTYTTSAVGQTPDTFFIQIINKDTYKTPIIYKLALCDLLNYPQNNDGTTTVKFKLPNNIDPGHCALNSTVSSTDIPFYIKSSIVSGIVNPLIAPLNIKIHYYNIQGEEIEKPSQGFAIWRAETGESGKIYINN